MDAIEIVLLYDYYGDLLTDRQRECFEMRYYQDLSLGEIAEELGISRQGVHDNLARTEAQLRKMEAKTGCVSRDLTCRKAAKTIADLARRLQERDGNDIFDLVQKIIDTAQELEE